MSEQPKVVAVVFGQVLRDTREAEGQSQEELAKRSKLNRTFISFLERGLRQPTLATILSLARGLHLRAGKLIERVERRIRKKFK